MLRMKSIVAFTFLSTVAYGADTHYSIAVYAPEILQLDSKVVNARNQSFMIGSLTPSTMCDLFNQDQCPPGNSTLVDDQMTSLAVSIPDLKDQKSWEKTQLTCCPIGCRARRTIYLRGY
jgi:hypothetical protein